MPKGIHPATSPELLKILAEMGRGDQLAPVDTHLPGRNINARVLRAGAPPTSMLLEEILEPDRYAPPPWKAKA